MSSTVGGNMSDKICGHERETLQTVLDYIDRPNAIDYFDGFDQEEINAAAAIGDPQTLVAIIVELSRERGIDATMEPIIDGSERLHVVARVACSDGNCMSCSSGRPSIDVMSLNEVHGVWNFLTMPDARVFALALLTAPTPHRRRRGKLVPIPLEWLGKVTGHCKRNARQSKKTRKAHRRDKARGKRMYAVDQHTKNHERS